MLNQEIHTESSIALLGQRCDELQAALKTVRRGGLGWQINKFFKLTQFAPIIKLVASKPYTNAGSGERQHKHNKAAAAYTNNRIDTRCSQVAQHAERAAAARRVLHFTELPVPERRSMGKRAVAEGRVTLPYRCLHVNMLELVARTPAVAWLLEKAPQLAWLQWSTLGWCGDEGRQEGALPTVDIYDTVGFPWYRRLGATRVGVKLRAAVSPYRANFVAIRAPGYSAETPVEYVGEVMAFVVLRFADGTRSGPLAFIRWYIEEEGEFGEQMKAELHMTPLVVETEERPDGDGRHPTVEKTELVDANEIIRPVYVQQNPVKVARSRTQRFLLNTFVSP